MSDNKTNIDGVEYSEVEIEKVVVNGKEQVGTVIYPEQTKGVNTINITLYAKNNVVQTQEVVAESEPVNKENE